MDNDYIEITEPITSADDLIAISYIKEVNRGQIMDEINKKITNKCADDKIYIKQLDKDDIYDKDKYHPLQFFVTVDNIDYLVDIVRNIKTENFFDSQYHTHNYCSPGICRMICCCGCPDFYTLECSSCKKPIKNCQCDLRKGIGLCNQCGLFYNVNKCLCWPCKYRCLCVN